MADWEIKVSKSAKKYLAKIDTKKRENLLIDIKLLKDWVENKNQINIDVTALKGQWEGKLRLRSGSIRVIFEIIITEKEIKILYIGPRGDIY
ncbi:MAG: type II toxin-antitoxin system RelE/ParE family toxin [bacterium]|nr:type II toxin-antitoxin system RelE/ParE family toxin [bacterium]